MLNRPNGIATAQFKNVNIVRIGPAGAIFEGTYLKQ